MRHSASEYLPAVLNAIAGIGVLLISFLVELRFRLSAHLAKQIGIAIVALGMLIAVWAAYHLRGAFLGEVEPTGEELVQSGPYRFVRHPVYFGMTIALAGAAISLRSWIGLLGVFGAFMPSEIYRAKLEEKALRRKFGTEWEAYAGETGFLLPFL
jgi:protein-S-isoprenylcysteine O-methyltransferase Ste14